MNLVVHDTRSRSKKAFEPITPGRVSMYVCGPTVYDHPHLGHARAAVAFDIIRRTLEAMGNKVTYVQNITDVDDKIIDRAAEEGVSPFEVAERYTRSYEEQMRRLGVRSPSLTPKATGHITDMVELIQRLIDAGVAYAVEGGDVYFSVGAFGGYGSLSGRSLEDMRAGERVEPDPRKRHPMDFALWKGAKNPFSQQVSWPAPWGAGRPGWHIECSAMSMKYLSETFDIHGGGQDLIFPHHENEAAQSEAVTGAPLARYWLHNGFVTVNEEKMSKSLKNFMLLSDVLDEQPPPVVRTLLASVHYRSPLEMNADVLGEARAIWDRFATFARNARAAAAGVRGEVDERFRERFLDAMSDDFNTPEAFAVLHDLLNEANPVLEKVEGGADPQPLAAMLATFSSLAGVLGLDPVEQWSEDAANGRMAPLVEALLALRADARAAKDFARADGIRDVLTGAGVVVEDRPAGARWYLDDPWS
ncbi:MAG TPA: cysteine--tRNA ligase [Actinomycetota bacterium]